MHGSTAINSPSGDGQSSTFDGKLGAGQSAGLPTPSLVIAEDWTMSMKVLLTVFLASSATIGVAQGTTPQTAPIKMWRLDCGTIDASLSGFSDTGLYQGQSRTLVASCYLIKHGDTYLLWDTGLDGTLAGKPKGSGRLLLKERIVPQLARIGVKPEDVNLVGVSHHHFDHVGQLGDFPNATLLIGKADLEVLKIPQSTGPDMSHWTGGKGKVEPLNGDKDVFGDGRVVMLAMPGHTPGHQSLYVRLASGAVLLSGDQYHFAEQLSNKGVPPFNHNRADTLASHDRFERIAANYNAKIIIQHEPADVAKLPAFPESAE